MTNKNDGENLAAVIAPRKPLFEGWCPLGKWSGGSLYALSDSGFVRIYPERDPDAWGDPRALIGL